MKFCINCVHFFCPDEERLNTRTATLEMVPRNPEYALCRREERPRSLVTGKHEGEPYPYCAVARESPCGSSARFYQEKDIPVTQEEEEAFQELDNTCKVCKQDTMCLVGNGNYFKCGTCGFSQKPEREEP